MENEIITPIVFIWEYLWLKDLNSVSPQWSEYKMEKHPAIYYRFLQVQSILKAYNINSIHEFESGDFIFKRTKEQYMGIVELLEKYETLWYKRRLIHDTSLKYMFEVFEIFMKYRIALTKVLAINSGVLAASGYYMFAYSRIQKVNNYAFEKCDEIDNLLGFIVSPEMQEFEERYLVEHFGYPAVDLGEIDIENY